MSSGVGFDPAEFAAFKARASGSAERNPPAPSWRIPGDDPAAAPPAASSGFDPEEFAAFKASRPTAGPASFDDRFGFGPMSRATDAAPDGLGHELRRVADERLVGKPDASTPALAALYRAGNTAGLNLPRNAAAGIATGLGVLGAPGYSPRSFSENYDLAKDQEEAFARQAPKSALAGTVGGIVGGAVALPAFRAAEGAGLGARAVANLKTGAAYGGVTEFADTKDLTDAGIGAGIGGISGAAGGYVIDKAAPIVMGLFRRGVPIRDASGALTEQATAALREAGVEPTAITPEIEAAFRAKGPSAGAAREAMASEFDLPLSRGQATGDPRALALEGASLSGARGPRAQAAGRDFDERQATAIDAAHGRLQGMAARGEPLIEGPQAAFEAVANRARDAGARYADDAARARAEQDAALQAVRGAGAPDAIEGAGLATQGVRDAAERSRGAYRAAYDDVAAIPGRFAPGALDRAGSRVRERLGTALPIDDVLTPAATRALADLDDLPGVLGLQSGEGPSLAQVEQIRRRLLAYRNSTGANATDREAMRQILGHFDDHARDAADLGLFGQRAAPAGGDGRLTGAAMAEASPAGARSGAAADLIPLPEAPGGTPESLTRYLARNGGIPLDAEARAGDLHRLYVPGSGTLARTSGRSWDDWRAKLVEDGFLPYREGHEIAAGDVADWARNAIQAERTGRGRIVRMDDEARAGGSRAMEQVAEQNASHAAMVDRQARRMAIDLEGVGLRPQDLDQGALNHAAERMVLGQHHDPVDAYEAALLRRSGESGQTAAGGARGEDVPFSGAGEAAGAGNGFPAGDTAAVDAMSRARALFREHQQAFRPRGVGDVAGQRLQRIVERDAAPNEVAGMLFGSPGTGRVTAGQMQTLARVREAVGADSPAWQATQQALLARHLGGDGRDLGGRLDYLLRGEGRGLTAFLSDEQRGGLGRLRAAVAQTEATGAAAPAWVSDLERTGFDPNRVASSLFGSGAIGSRPGALNEARAAKAFLGADSAEWSALRQAAVQRITGSGDSSLKAGRIVDQVRAFTDGSGSGLARELFTDAELGQLRRYAGALSSALRPDGAAKADIGTARRVAGHALDALATSVAFKLGGVAGAAATAGVRPGTRTLNRVSAGAARRSFEGGAPRVSMTLPDLRTDRLAVGSGEYAGQR